MTNTELPAADRVKQGAV